MTALAIIAACAVVLLALLLTAPEGYEDAHGYHDGKPPERVP